MFCTNCGNPLNPDATQCPACHAALGERATRPVVTSSSKASATVGKLVGRTLGGRYQLNSLIGSGGMGEIYRAHRTHIGDTVAVKVLRADIVGNDKSRQRFFREARAAALLHHPNAVVIHDFGEDDGGLAYIVMELLIGRSLREVLQAEQTLDPLRTYGILRQAAAALEAGHRSGIVHRDIKPDNIVLLDATDDHDHVKILDFGIAKLRETALESGEPVTPHSSDSNNLTNAGMVIGTPNYMSPEQCQGEEADARSDIYSMGVVMYETLTGVMPFTGKTPTSVAIKHVTEAPRPLRALRPDLPIEIEAVVLRALAKAPESRQQSMRDLTREYAQALHDVGLMTSSQQPTVSGLGVRNTNQVVAERSTAVLQPTAPSVPLGDTFQTSISDTPVSGSMPAVEAPVPGWGVPKPAAHSAPLGDTFQTSISDTPVSGSMPAVEAPVPGWDAPTLRPQSHDLTDALPTLVEPAAAGAESFATVITESPLPRARDEYATMIPEGPGLAARPNPFAETSAAPPQVVSSVPASETLIDPLLEHEKTAAATVVKASDSGILVELPNAQDTSKLKGTSASQKVLLLGLVSVVLVAGAWVWSLLTQDNQDKRAQPSPTPAAQVSVTIAPQATMVPPEGMVLIPGGEIVIGRAEGEDNEKPPHKVAVAPFYIDLTEVTVEQYAYYLSLNLDHPPPPSWQGRIPPPGTEKLPVTDVSWRDASDYAVWKQRRLPTEEEWEFAARGSEGRLYPWGNTFQPGHANIADDEKDKHKLQAVGTYLLGKSRYGILDLIGNAWEWTDSDYQGYEGTEVNVPEGYLNLKVIRGGSYSCLPKQAAATYRRGWPATVSDWPDGAEPNYGETGFRTAQDVPKR